MATLVEAYLERLGLPAACLADGPTLPLLETLVEAHLATLPFSNLSQHLAGGDAAPSLSPSRLQEKLLARRHGGNCFELNGLFALLLRDIGLETLLLQCRVWTGRERGNRGKPGYRRHPTHLLLLGNARFLVDVGFGEPPLGPLRYSVGEGSEQVTAEGMRSRMVQLGDGMVQLESWRDAGRDPWHVRASPSPATEAGWVPRLSWAEADVELFGAAAAPCLADFAAAQERCLAEGSTLRQKLVVCRLLREEKVTVAGTQLRITSPRFKRGGRVPTQRVAELGCTEGVRAALLEHYCIPREETSALQLDASVAAPGAWWRHL
ncbi:hypothetical protein EMIHUDRAFT_219862 [Emiliania huxleyi CCMP1516]|uniref:Arylamine N-acetyltransferase n=2 Tax=Emiliania huxleyi TaxID=2903 RepID=A0A0D3I3E1_EMIH1|nr:hypothetical protein EMIHUDRAFT_219862 [Emiliania huxleyi CCMP1516]EOD05776.1 hypothetical protein EMIHUDRAFT_219862 [Emiliania huxleyi CCMP1516]|eukprot:XP_005758205.1 hypothetical protein EMIHUDRAFT_219862 [Emiliania huxleyi CCMP1516]